MVSVKQISKNFGQTTALDDLTFTIKTGEIVGLLGPNGAGKSTTMRIITGYLSPDTGMVSVEGIDVLENPLQAQAKIGYLPENNPLYKEMLVVELLAFIADIRRLSADKRREALDFVVETCGLSEVYHQPVNQLSKGYKQRVGIALALIHKPSVLILDEPTEGLDPNQRTEVRSLIRKLAINRTVIVSTHVMQEVEAVCNRLLLLNHGHLVADGTSKSLKKLAKIESGLQVLIEGNKVLNSIKGIKGVDRVEVIKSTGSKVELKIYPLKHILLQPELSKLAAKNNWIIWKLAESDTNLEEIFHELTQN